MQRFFFHLHDDFDLADPEGAELPDLAAAFEHARRTALDLMCGMVIAEQRIVLHHRIDIEDEQQSVMGTVRFGDVVTVQD